jgi:hypothetical protein
MALSQNCSYFCALENQIAKARGKKDKIRIEGKKE